MEGARGAKTTRVKESTAEILVVLKDDSNKPLTKENDIVEVVVSRAPGARRSQPAMAYTLLPSHNKQERNVHNTLHKS